MKYFLAFFLFAGLMSVTAQNSAKESIDQLLNEWHDAAARADFDTYFSKMAEESVFIGTDPTENWDKPEFIEWSKPYFEKGKACHKRGWCMEDQTLRALDRNPQ